MKLLFQQRILSWFDSYDVYDEQNQPIFRIKGELSLGHLVRIYDGFGNELAMIEERIIRLLPKFDVYKNDVLAGTIEKEFTLFRPYFYMNYTHWSVQGELFEWDYTIKDEQGETIAYMNKQLINLSDTYVMDVLDEANVLDALIMMVVIDLEKCSRG